MLSGLDKPNTNWLEVLYAHGNLPSNTRHYFSKILWSAELLKQLTLDPFWLYGWAGRSKPPTHPSSVSWLAHNSGVKDLNSGRFPLHIHFSVDVSEPTVQVKPVLVVFWLNISLVVATIKLCLFLINFLVHLLVLNITKINRYFVFAWGSARVVFTAICKLAIGKTEQHVSEHLDWKDVGKTEHNVLELLKNTLVKPTNTSLNC